MAHPAKSKARTCRAAFQDQIPPAGAQHCPFQDRLIWKPPLGGFPTFVAGNPGHARARTICTVLYRPCRPPLATLSAIPDIWPQGLKDELLRYRSDVQPASQVAVGVVRLRDAMSYVAVARICVWCDSPCPLLCDAPTCNRRQRPLWLSSSREWSIALRDGNNEFLLCSAGVSAILCPPSVL